MRTHVNGYNGNRMHFTHCCLDHAANNRKKRTRISRNDNVIAMKRKLDTFDFGIKMAKLLNGHVLRSEKKLTIIFHSDEGATTLNQTIVTIFYDHQKPENEIKHSIWFMALHHRNIHCANEIQWHWIGLLLSIHFSFIQSKVKVRINGSSHSHRKTARHFPIFHLKSFCSKLNGIRHPSNHFLGFPNNFPFENKWNLFVSFIKHFRELNILP